MCLGHSFAEPKSKMCLRNFSRTSFIYLNILLFCTEKELVNVFSLVSMCQLVNSVVVTYSRVVLEKPDLRSYCTS